MTNMVTLLRAVRAVERLAPDDHWMIGGGFIRDLILGRTPKDIDVIIPTCVGWQAGWHLYSQGDAQYDFGRVLATGDPIGEHAVVDGHPIQLVYRDVDCTVEATAMYHPVGLSNAFWVPGEGLVLHKTFLRDAATETIHTNPFCGWSVSKDAYLARIREKYDWPVVDTDFDNWPT